MCDAKRVIFKEIHLEAYESAIRNIQGGKPISKNSSILSLNPYLDDNGILRKGGRLKHSTINANSKHPIIIPKESHIATLLLAHFHKKIFHQWRN